MLSTFNVHGYGKLKSIHRHIKDTISSTTVVVCSCENIVYTMRGINTIFTVAVLVASALAEDPWTPSPLCPFPSEEQTRYPYEGDCSKYWECFEGARYPMTCPSGLEFNAVESKCDDPSKAKCDPDATITYPTFPHSTQSTQSTLSTADPGPLPECPFPSEELTFFPVVNNCSQYWECYEGNRYLMTCPPNLYWNVITNTCDYLDNVDCDRNNQTTTTPLSTPTPLTTSSSIITVTQNVTTTPLSTTTTNVTSDPICNGLPNGTYLPDPNDCSKYYECDNGSTIVQQCSGNLLWNQEEHTCDYPDHVNCTVTYVL